MTDQTQEQRLILPSGKYKGQSVVDVADKDPDYLLFIYHNSGYGGIIKTWIFDNLICK